MAVSLTIDGFRWERFIIFAASGLIWVENQVSLGANETVMGKARFEQWLWDMAYARSETLPW